MSEKIALREVGMRDGLQSIATVLPTETKLAWLDAEYAAGVRYVEVSSFVPPKLLPQLADAEAVIAHAMTLRGLHVSALIPNSRGAERGMTLGVPEMNYVLSVSNGHNLSNVRRPTEESIEDFRRVVALCHSGSKPARINCGLATSFGCTIEGDVDEDRVRRIANEIAEAGADGIILADTVGYGQPAAIERVFRKVIADVAPLPVAAHFHDTRGLGIANVLAAYNAGCREFDASLGGLGGCPYAPGATGN
ncbi:MAG: hydroxymethylglutaryl-CoA lyase, partial [Stellaceae bacterium]